MRARSIGSVILVALAGCGRIGFDITARADDGGGRDASTADAGMRDASETDAGFPADAGMCLESPCRLPLPQCGCGPEEMCAWGFAGARTCAPSGAGLVGETCAGALACAAGAGCVMLGPGPGQCLRWCESAADCEASTECSRFDWTTGPGVCSLICDPVAMTGCPAPLDCGIGLGLEITSGEPVIVALCANLGAGVDGSRCLGPLDCGAGLVCFGSTCRPVCERAPMPTMCASGRTCEFFDPPAIIGAIEYGACA